MQSPNIHVNIKSRNKLTKLQKCRAKEETHLHKETKRMNSSNTQNQQKAHGKHTMSNNKKRLTHDQVMLLERSFTTNKKLDQQLKLQFAKQLGVPPRQVAIWYQNKRARWKTQTIELDYNTLQVKLENALVDKRNLEKEVLQLREALRKAREMLYSLNNCHSFVAGNGGYTTTSEVPFVNYVGTSNCNSSCDEGMTSSSLNEDANGEVLQLDELYACLIAGNGHDTVGIESIWRNF